MKNITQFSVKNGLATDPENGRFYTFVTEFANEYPIIMDCKIENGQKIVYRRHP
jgi:hypothetical protein